MITEIYKIQPIDGSDIQQLAAEGENIELRERLGLPPLKLKDECAKPFVFRYMTEEESKVYSVLFPKQTKIENYTQFIPNQVLEALQEFQDTCPYKVVDTPRVWHAKDYDPDPILTVEIRTANDEFSCADRVVMIARWGEALVPFAELAEVAFKRWRANRIAELKKLIREAQTELIDAEEAVSIGKTGEPRFFA